MKLIITIYCSYPNTSKILSTCNQYKNSRIFYILFFIPSLQNWCIFYTYSTPPFGPTTFHMPHSLTRPVPTVLDSIVLAAPNTTMNFDITTLSLTWVSWNLRQKWKVTVWNFAFSLLWVISTFPPKVWVSVFKHFPSSHHKGIIMKEIYKPVYYTSGSFQP